MHQHVLIAFEVAEKFADVSVKSKRSSAALL
jgi:hypothetical protein